MLVVGGENLIDFIQTDAATGNPTYQANPGGSPFNCAMAIARQQVPVSYLTPISTDALGNLLADRLRASGVTLCGKRRPEPTSLAVVSLTNAVPSYQFYRDNAAERMVTHDGLSASCPENPAAFHIGSLTLTGGADADIWAEFFVSLHARGIFTSLDPNIRAAFITDRTSYLARLDRMLAATDLLKLSDEDLGWLDPGTDIDIAAQRLFDRSAAKLLVVTLGRDGAFALSKTQSLRIPAAPVARMQDTVGAGDTFMATLLTGLHAAGMLDSAALGQLDAPTLQDLLTRAAIAAALNCRKAGCDPPDLAALTAAQGPANSRGAI